MEKERVEESLSLTASQEQLKHVKQIQLHHESESVTYYEASLVEREKDTLRQATEDCNQQYDALTMTALQTINMLDQIASSYQQTTENEEIAQQLQQVAFMAIQQLQPYGVEEIPVMGEPFDPATMESFGRYKEDEEPSEQPVVALVHRRAFRQGDRIIQDAIVYTT